MHRASLIEKAIAVAIVTALLGICVADVVHAAMPMDTRMECGTRLCDALSGCAAMTVVLFHGLPIATVPVSTVVVAASAPAWIAFVAQAPSRLRPQHPPSAPRSPPLA